MSIQRMASHTILLGTLVLVAMLLSACYKDAGENVPPTSKQINLGALTPTTPALPTQAATATPTPMSEVSPTRQLVPTTTPSDAIQDELSATPTLLPQDGESGPGELLATPTNAPLVEAGVSPTAISGTPTEVVTQTTIATPGLSDIRPSNTPAPTIDPALLPTPTAIPVEENPCIHVVSPGDTLFSIASDNEVELEALVVANPELLGGNPNAILQIGWQLKLPGCEDVAGLETPVPAEATSVTGEATVVPAGGEQTGPVVHVVQPGEGIYAIARQYGVEPQAIVEANNLINPNLIYPGDELIIPVGQ